MKQPIQDLLILLLLIFILSIAYTCNKTPKPEPKEKTVYIKGKTITVVDTFYKDTIIYKPVPKIVYLADTTHQVDCDSVREYTECLDDSSGLVVVESKVQGELLSQRITLQSYMESNFRVDTLKVYESRHSRIIAPIISLRGDAIGGGFLINSKRHIFGGTYSTDKTVNVIYGYNLSR